MLGDSQLDRLPVLRSSPLRAVAEFVFGLLALNLLAVGADAGFGAVVHHDVGIAPLIGVALGPVLLRWWSRRNLVWPSGARRTRG